MHSYQNNALQIFARAAMRGELRQALAKHDWKKHPAVLVSNERGGAILISVGDFKKMERLYWNRTGIHARDPRPAKVRIYENGELVVFDSCEWMPREVADAMV